MRNMRWVHVVLNYGYMIIIKIVANIYLALKICRLKKFWESHQLFWACHGRGLIYLSIIKGNTVVNHCACAFFLAVRARFSHMSNQQDSWCFFCFPMKFWLVGEEGQNWSPSTQQTFECCVVKPRVRVSCGNLLTII